jgi:hypothetical protein
VQQTDNLAMDLGDRLGTLRFLIHDRDPPFTTASGDVLARTTADHHYPAEDAKDERHLLKALPGLSAANCWARS